VVRSKLRGLFENAPIKLIAVVLFAVLVPSVLVTALGIVAVFQAGEFVRDRFSAPLGEKLGRLEEDLGEEWARTLDFYAEVLRDAQDRRDHLGELREKDPHVRDVLFFSGGELVQAPASPPASIWSPESERDLKKLHRLEVLDKNDSEALAECQRLLGSSSDEAVLVEAYMAAARLAYRLGRKDESVAYLRAARARFGYTLDATGVLREVPILWRLFEIERELNLISRAKDTAAELQSSLQRHARHLSADVAAFYQEKLSSLSEPFTPSPPLGTAGSTAASRLVPAASLPVLATLLPRSESAFGGKSCLTTHLSLEGVGEMDWVSFRGDKAIVVHLLLDREKFLDEVLLEGQRVGWSPGGFRLVRADGSTVRNATVDSTTMAASRTLPSPLENLLAEYFAAPGEIPQGFRGFNVLSLATFTWAVILLVLTIVVGVLFTIRSVLREMRTARMKSDFVSFISHELKTPLTAIRMFTETILSGRVEDAGETRMCIEMIDRESERLSKLIEQIMEFSRIERHQKKFKFSTCDMEEVVREAVKIFKDNNPADAREIEINSVQHISKIQMDRAAMIELFLNLLSNASKYSPHGQKITVNLRESIDDISVDVCDHGVGIRKRDQKRIFDKFYRADDYLTREVEGTGLGLAFARYIAQAHNGDVRVSSQVNSGSTFTVQLRKTKVLAE
jgi:signal transduction histidine kinase